MMPSTKWPFFPISQENIYNSILDFLTLRSAHPEFSVHASIFSPGPFQIFTSFMEEQGFGHGSEHSGHSISYFKSLCTESAWFGEESSARPKRASAINIALRCRPSGIVSPTGRRVSEEHVYVVRGGADAFSISDTEGIEDSDPPDVVAGASADHNPSTTTSMLHFLSRTADCAPLVYNFSLYERKLARAHRSHAAALQNSDTVQRAQSLSTSGPLEGSPRVSHNLASPRSSQDRPSPRSSHLVRRRSFPKHGLLNLATRPDAATTHESFISVLLVEIATKVKKCVLEAIGTEVADSLGCVSDLEVVATARRRLMLISVQVFGSGSLCGQLHCCTL